MKQTGTTRDWKEKPQRKRERPRIPALFPVYKELKKKNHAIFTKREQWILNNGTEQKNQTGNDKTMD